MKKFCSFLIALVLVLSLSACGKEIVLNLSYGERSGIYAGDLNEEGLPHGMGKFTSQNSEGEKWTYEGEFKNGHFDGVGKTTWATGTKEIGTYRDDVIVPLSGEELNNVYGDPEEYKDYYISVVGKVFTEPEYLEDSVGFQIWADSENSEKNTFVTVFDPEFKVKTDDYVRIIGKVGGAFSGENAFGGVITAPIIHATEYEIISYKDAVMPTLKEITVNQTQTQYGYSVTVEKVELAEKETRVYLKIDNRGSDKFTLYTFDAKISQNGKQYEEQDNWDAEYPEIQSDILVGNSTSGVIAFPAIEEGAFVIEMEASSDNWDEKIVPYRFTLAF